MENKMKDMDLHDYESDEEGNLVIHSKQTGRTIILGSVFPTKEIAEEVRRILHEKR